MILYYLSVCPSISTGNPVVWCKGCWIRKLSVCHWPNKTRQIFKKEDHINGKEGCNNMGTMNILKGKSKFEESSFLLRNNKAVLIINQFSSVQFSSVAQSCPTLCDPMNRSTPGLPVYHQLPEFIQIHIHRVSDAIQPLHPLSSPSPPAPNPSQHQSLFQWVSSSHEVAKVLEFQL